MSPTPNVIPSPLSSLYVDLYHSTRVRASLSHLQDCHVYHALASIYEPSYREASNDPLWKSSMDQEIEDLTSTRTQDMVDLPLGKTATGCKWIYKIKTKANGSIKCYKARLMAKGYAQEYGIDYKETFAPVTRLTTIRSPLGVAFVRQWLVVGFRIR